MKKKETIEIAGQEEKRINYKSYLTLQVSTQMSS